MITKRLVIGKPDPSEGVNCHADRGLTPCSGIEVLRVIAACLAAGAVDSAAEDDDQRGFR